LQGIADDLSKADRAAKSNFKSGIIGLPSPEAIQRTAAAQAQAAQQKKQNDEAEYELKKKLFGLESDLRKATFENQAAITTDERTQAEMRFSAAKEEMDKKVKELAKSSAARKEIEADYTAWLTSEIAKMEFNARTPLQKLADDWSNTTKQMRDASVDWANRAADALTEFVMTGKLHFKDFARSIIADLIRIQIQSQLAGMFRFFGGFGGGQGTGSGTSGGVGGPPAFATGGNFTVGGSGGTDSQLVSFRATPGERVQVTTPGQQSGGITVINNNNFSLGVKETVRAEIMGLMPQITDQTKASVQTAIERGGSMSRSVGRRR
jgi:lambda family phage tail tape measure protein